MVEIVADVEGITVRLRSTSVAGMVHVRVRANDCGLSPIIREIGQRYAGSGNDGWPSG